MLYKHQQDAVKFILARGGVGALFMDCGTGKCLTALSIFGELKAQMSSLRLVVICPLSLIESAWILDIQKFTQFTFFNAHDKKLNDKVNADIVLINYESMIRNKELAHHIKRNMLVIDECFDGKTFINTPNGKKRIKNIKKGDFILNCTGIDKVTGTKIKKLDRWIKIKYNNRWVQCSYNHPFLTSKGWISAYKLKKGDSLVKTKYAMSMVWEKITETNTERKINNFKQKSFLQHFLLGEMENKTTRVHKKSLYFGSKKKDFSGIKQVYDEFAKRNKVCKSKTSKQDVFTRSKKKSIFSLTKNKMEANNSGGKWKTFTNSPIKTSKVIRKILATRVHSKDTSKTATLSTSLQNRFGSSQKKDRNRSGWFFTYRLREKRARQEEKRFANFFRVEDIKIYKQRSNGKRPGCSKKNLFYDLQIKNHPSFSVNNVLVHNSSRMKNNRAITTKKLLQHAALPRFKMIMSGTPAPNSPVEYWGQMTFLDENILHKSFYAFRNTYFHLARNGEIMQGRFMSRQQAQEIFSRGWEYAISPENLTKLMVKINPYVFRAKKDECLDLPDQVDEVRLVELSTEQRKHYNEMKRHLITELAGQFVTAQVALAKILKLREITSGHLISGDKTIAIANPAKIKELSALLEELGNQPVIIWGNFVWEIEAIQKLLGEKAVSVYGKTDDKHIALEDFKAGKYQYLIANMNSISHGVTLVNCSTQVFFSLSYSWEQWIQCKNRIHRIGAVKKCTYIHILAKDTIDEQIYKVLQDKGNMESITLGMVKK